MKVENMRSTRTGKAVANQFIIRDNGKVWFQSYETVICFVDECNNVFLDNGESYDASRNEYHAENEPIKSHLPFSSFPVLWMDFQNQFY